MSGINVLLNNYNRVMEVTEFVNQSIITLKKCYLKGMVGEDDAAKLNVQEEEVKEAEKNILTFVGTILASEKNDIQQGDDIPAVIQKELKQAIEKIPLWKSKLELIEKDIKSRILSKEVFDQLDDLVAALDNERTAIFRKLRAARG